MAGRVLKVIGCHRAVRWPCAVTAGSSLGPHKNAAPVRVPFVEHEPRAQRPEVRKFELQAELLMKRPDDSRKCLRLPASGLEYPVWC
jgi:hypothetical protein